MEFKNLRWRITHIANEAGRTSTLGVRGDQLPQTGWERELAVSGRLPCKTTR